MTHYWFGLREQRQCIGCAHSQSRVLLNGEYEWVPAPRRIICDATTQYAANREIAAARIFAE
jgi:hypothetical protein